VGLVNARAGGCLDGAGLNAPALVAFAAPRTRLISRTATCMCCSASHGNGPWDVGWVENLLGSLEVRTVVMFACFMSRIILANK